MKLEIACFNLESAIIAQRAGADRIELCDGFSVGGITPGEKIFDAARKVVIVDLFAMIRPRGGNFTYSDAEFEQMKKQLLQLKKSGADGFVFGIVNVDGSINKNQNTELVELAKPLPCTFHRAVDSVNDSATALERIIDCGFKTVLTSGRKETAEEGITQLSELINQATGRIVIMPGGAVRSVNIDKLTENLNTFWYHSSGISSGEVANVDEIKLLKEKVK